VNLQQIHAAVPNLVVTMMTQQRSSMVVVDAVQKADHVTDLQAHHVPVEA
jgi:hypothetical protein